MVIPEYNDGKSEDHPDLIRDSRRAAEVEADEKRDTRKGGQAETEPKIPQRIIVDMREFRSELPALIHKRGIEIDPVTIEVCDVKYSCFLHSLLNAFSCIIKNGCFHVYGVVCIITNKVHVVQISCFVLGSRKVIAKSI